MIPRFNKLMAGDAFHWDQLRQQADFARINEPFLEDLQRLALGSNYAIRQLVKYSELLSHLKKLASFKLQSEQLESALRDLKDQDEIKKQLRLFRHHKMVEIIFLDICRQQATEETLLQISDLADCLITQALDKAQQLLAARHGQPRDAQGNAIQLNIIGMGKLGGHELNFSSDIDLICCYSEEGELEGIGKLSHAQFFSHVVKLFKALLHEATADGFVYRVDLRLRPWGDSGPVAISHSALEYYYQLHGREWEQYAMVKARVITGSDADRQALQAILRPFVYRRYHDYRVFDGLSQLKNQIDRQARRQGKDHNIKLGPGGIREIEFFVQAFQILKGGRNHQLQTPSILRAMMVLEQQQIIDNETLQHLRDGYLFLRQLENRIQMMNDQQTHEIPAQSALLARIAFTLGHADSGALMRALQTKQDWVSNEFSSLFEQPDETASSELATDWRELNPEQQQLQLQQLGFKDSNLARQQLEQFYHSKAMQFMSNNATQRLHSFLPQLLKLVAANADASTLLPRLLKLITAIAGRSVYFELLYQNIPLLEKLVKLFASSAWIADQVTRYPMLLESILYPGALEERFDRDRLTRELAVQLQNVAGDAELELDILRQFKRSQTIVIASAELTQEIDAKAVSLYLCDLAQILLQAVYHLSWQAMVAQYGEPGCLVDGAAKSPALAIIAYGKLGGLELHYQSDLDIIFVHDSRGEAQQTLGAKSIDNAIFFARLAQKIISSINLRTAAGQLYEIDTRLRPDGASGMLVSSLSAYQQYLQEKAWVWEHQALIRARFVAGQQSLAPTFEHIRRSVLCLPREQQPLQQAVVEMRDKMYQAMKPPEGKIINLKHSRGGLVDIEFIVQYRVLLHANKFASLCETTDNIRLLTALHELNLISDQDLQLRDIYQTFHELLHARVLQNQSADIPSDTVQPQIDQVQACWNSTFNR